jgi:hypothetical protein
MPKTRGRGGPKKPKKPIPFPVDPFAGRKRFQKAVEDAMDILDDDGFDAVALQIECHVLAFTTYKQATGESLSKHVKEELGKSGIYI